MASDRKSKKRCATDNNASRPCTAALLASSIIENNTTLARMTAASTAVEIILSTDQQKREQEEQKEKFLHDSKENLFLKKLHHSWDRLSISNVPERRPSQISGRRMATPQSPTRMFNGLSEDDALYSDAKYAHEINDKMRVPKRIRATGEYSDEDLLLSNQNGVMNSWNYHDKIDMNVPDRIVVLGHEEHLGTRSAPREILLEDSILPKDPGFVRVATPPRVITLHDHHFPSASDNNSPNNNMDYHNTESPQNYIRADAHAAHIGFNPNGTSSRADSDSEAITTSTSGISKKAVSNYNNDTTLVSHREGTPVIGDLTPPEEILYLRRQLAKLNRRVLSIEIDNVQRSQREKIVYCMGLAYFLLKAIFWLNRN